MATRSTCCNSHFVLMMAEDVRIRDLARKSVHDPLTSINQQLAKISDDAPRPASSRPRQQQQQPRPPGDRDPRSARGGGGQASEPQVAERLSRESSERRRALELIARRKREMAGSATPSTVYGGMDDGGYGDQYNRREVEEAHRYRDRRESFARDDRRSGGGGRRW